MTRRLMQNCLSIFEGHTIHEHVGQPGFLMSPAASWNEAKLHEDTIKAIQKAATLYVSGDCPPRQVPSFHCNIFVPANSSRNAFEGIDIHLEP